jgi:hypothetical protein
VTLKVIVYIRQHYVLGAHKVVLACLPKGSFLCAQSKQLYMTLTR